MKETFRTLGKATTAVAFATGVLFGTGKAIQSAPQILDEINLRSYEAAQIQEKKPARKLEDACRDKYVKFVRGTNPNIKIDYDCLKNMAYRSGNDGYFQEAINRAMAEGPSLSVYVSASIDNSLFNKSNKKPY